MTSLYFVSLVAFGQKNQNIDKLKAQVLQLEAEKEEALISQKALLQEIESQNDPKWLELVLKRKLGVVSKGECKVRFKNETGEFFSAEGV